MSAFRSLPLYAWVVAAAALVLGAPAALASRATTAPLPSLPTKPMSASERARITATVRSLMASKEYKADVPGFTIGIWSPTDGAYEATFGKADLRSGKAPTTASSFRIGSVSKTFTATVILGLVDDHKLSLDGKVKTYLPKLAKKYPAIGTRTVAQLLGMRSGLPEYSDALAGGVPASAMRVWTADQLIDFAMKSGPVKPAGAEKSVYTNTNYVILGEIARAVTGTPIGRLVTDGLLKPLGLTHTVYPGPRQVALPRPFTHGYVTASGAKEFEQDGATIEAGTDVTSWNPSWGNAAGIMSSTLEDLGRWGASSLGNSLLSPALRKARLTTAPQSDYWTYGLGMLVLVGDQWVGHSGGIPGWATWVLHNAKTGMTVVTSVNACCGGVPASFTISLLAQLYPETFKQAGSPLPANTPYQLSPRTSFTPAAGWTIDPQATVPNAILTATKSGVSIKLTDVLKVPAGQTFDAFVRTLAGAEQTTAFTTTSGLTGATWSSASATQKSSIWVVQNGEAIVKFDAYGPPATLTTLGAEILGMAKSISGASA